MRTACCSCWAFFPVTFPVKNAGPGVELALGAIFIFIWVKEQVALSLACDMNAPLFLFCFVLAEFSCSAPGCPATLPVDQAGLKFRDLFPSTGIKDEHTPPHVAKLPSALCFPSVPGIEPGPSYMLSKSSTTELRPQSSFYF
jgi:hypothetical protein